MRRRLWNTILELGLHARVYLGGPPLVAQEDFDCQVPGNFDDESLQVGVTSKAEAGGGEEGAAAAEEEGAGSQGLEKGADVFTGMMVPRAWRATFPVRLRVVKFLNDFVQHDRGRSSCYAETLELDVQLRAAFRTMRQALGRCAGAPESAASRSFAMRAVDFLAQRYTSALHAPFLGASLRESACAFSRKIMLDTTLKMWYAACPSSATVASSFGAQEHATTENQNIFPRFLLCSAGFFRTAAAQVTFVLPAELGAQIREDGHQGVLLRPDLLEATEAGKTWSLRCVEAGATNAKGHMTPCLLAAHMEGLRRGLGAGGEGHLHDDDEALGRFVVKEAEEALDRALVVLEDMAARTRPAVEGQSLAGEGELAQTGMWEGEGGGGGDGMALGDNDDGLEGMVTDDWDFMVSFSPSQQVFGIDACGMSLSAYDSVLRCRCPMRCSSLITKVR